MARPVGYAFLSLPVKCALRREFTPAEGGNWAFPRSYRELETLDLHDFASPIHGRNRVPSVRPARGAMDFGICTGGLFETMNVQAMCGVSCRPITAIRRRPSSSSSRRMVPQLLPSAYPPPPPLSLVTLGRCHGLSLPRAL